MKFMCVVEKDGKISLPAIIQNQLSADQRYAVELEVKERNFMELELKQFSPFYEEGIPIPYDALEESQLIDESHLRILVMDRAILVTCEDKILDMMAQECFK